MILPTDRPQAITPIFIPPLYPVPPYPLNSSPKGLTRNSSELSDGFPASNFPPIKIFRGHLKSGGLGRKNVLNSIDLTQKKPARNVKVRFRALVLSLR